MKERVIWKNQEYEMEWFDTKNFSDLEKSKIIQVYGFLFDKDDKICIVRPTEKRGWRLPGGGPEKEDINWQETIIREADEEADLEIDKNSLIPFGYFKVSPLSKNCERKEHFALRVLGKIIKINRQTEDISEELINERKFISPKDFNKIVNWKKTGEIQLNKAIEKLKELK